MFNKDELRKSATLTKEDEEDDDKQGLDFFEMENPFFNRSKTTRPQSRPLKEQMTPVTPVVPRAKVVAQGPPGLISESDFSKLEQSQIKIQLVKYEKKIIGTNMYVLHIEIGHLKVLAEAKKALDEFRAFHKALTLKFKTLQFVAFPKVATFSTTTQQEERMTVF